MYTAIMATRPSEPFIDSALKSVSVQTMQPCRTIVVVNGSPGQVRRAVISLQERHPGVEILGSRVPRMSDAFGRALRLVDTPYVAFLDADDEWFVDKQREQTDILDANPLVDSVIGMTENFWESSGGIRTTERPVWGRVFGACTFRTEVFQRCGMPDPDAEHFTWLYRWWAAADRVGIRIDRQDRPVLRRRIHEGNGWVADHEQGRRQLLAELRRINAERNRQ